VELAQLERTIRGTIAAVSPPGVDLPISVTAESETENTTLTLRVELPSAEFAFDLLRFLDLLRDRLTVTMCLLNGPPNAAIILHGASNSLAFAIVFDFQE
jgi:hypothetical protein